MKRYLLFAGTDYYPRGGADDFAGAFDDLSSAQASNAESRKHGRAESRKHSGWDWAHVFDADDGRIVAVLSGDGSWEDPDA